MKKALVAYFSASGSTERVAKSLASAIDADLHEIEPVKKYTKEDLDWTNKQSRSSLEMNDKSSRPEIKESNVDASKYQTLFIGFPIWWYTAPTIINTFLESQKLEGVTVVPFATSGGSQMGRTNFDLAPSCDGAKLIEGKRFPFGAKEKELYDWAKAYI